MTLGGEGRGGGGGGDRRENRADSRERGSGSCSKLGKKIDSQERRRHSIRGAPRAPRPPPRCPLGGRLRKGNDLGTGARGLVVCLPSNILHLMPQPDFLRPLVPEPVCKSLFEPSPDLPCPGTTEHTYSVPFSQEPKGGSPCKQGVTLPFFPHPPPVATLHLLPRNPPRSRGSPFSPRQERVLGATTHLYSYTGPQPTSIPLVVSPLPKY